MSTRTRSPQGRRPPRPKPPREVALWVLFHVETRKAFADLLLARTLRSGALNARDAALATELVNGTLRWRARLDWLLGKYVKSGLDTLTPWIRNVLRLGLYQFLFLDREGNVRSQTPIRREDVAPTYTGWSWFGQTIGAVGDVDRDGVPELAIADPFDTILIAFLRPDGSVREATPVEVLPGLAHIGPARAIVPLPVHHDGGVQIAVSSNPWFSFHEGPLLQRLVLDCGGNVVERAAYAEPDAPEFFGESLAVLDDLDGDGNGELAVGHPYWSVPGEPPTGAVWILFLDERGGEKRRGLIHPGEELTSAPAFWTFGTSIASAGDLDGDGIAELVVGEPFWGERTGLPPQGALWILYLNGTR